MPVTEEDIVHILEIEQEAISPPWTHGALLSEIYRDDSFFAVARSGQRESTKGSLLHGFIILRSILDEGELLQIAVGKDARRRGIADMLMASAIKNIEENSIRSVFLEVRKSNEAAISLYKKHGFKSVRLRRDYYTDPTEDAVVMVRV